MGALDKAAVARFLGAASDPIRLDIVFLLCEQGRMNVGDIAARFRLSRPAISHHLKVLKDAGLVCSARAGQEIGYWLDSAYVTGQLRLLADSVAACPDPAPEP